MATALQAGLDEFGGLDIVVANAGVAPMQAGEDGWRDVIDVNLTGVFHTVEVARPSMVEQGRGGSIVLISSVMGLAGGGSDDAGSIGYTAAKHGIVGLMRVYANLLAPHSIRVNSIHPAGVDTPMINNEFIQEWLGSIAEQSPQDNHWSRGTSKSTHSARHTSRGSTPSSIACAAVRPPRLVSTWSASTDAPYAAPN